MLPKPAILLGSFDPPTIGHIHLISEALRVGVSCVYVIPAFGNPWKTGQTEFYSNNFRCTVESGRNFTQEMITCHTTNAGVYFFIAYSRLNGVTATSTNAQKIAAFKEWLNNNPTEIEYQLKGTQYEEITKDELIEQLNEIQNMQMQDGETNIFWTGDVAPEMKLQYATKEELNAYIITENGKKIRTDWRKIERRNKWKTKSK